MIWASPREVVAAEGPSFVVLRAKGLRGMYETVECG